VRIKITKRSWIFIVIGIMVIAGACVGLIRSQQTDQQTQLHGKLELAQKKLAAINLDELTAEKKRLSLEIEGYQARTATAKNLLIFPEDNISVSGIILKTAGDCEVNIVNIGSPGRVKAVLSGTPCFSLPFNIEVAGNFSNISDLLVALSREFPTGLVSMVQASSAAPAPAPAPSPEEATNGTPEDNIPSGTDAVRASIRLVIYSLEMKSHVE
jgi:hypothetical protein